MDLIRLASPAWPLREYVRLYAHREVRAGGTAIIHPVPARAFPVLEFVFRDRFRVLSADQSFIQMSPRAVVVGLQTHCRSRLQFQGEVECFVVVFQPTGMQQLFPTPVDALTDRAYDAHSVLGAFVSELEQRLGNAQNFGQRARIANETLLRYSLRAGSFDRISAAARQTLCVSGNVRIPDLAGDAGLSVRQFERRFAQQVGVNPKLFARIVRFESALDSKARSPRKSWTEVAHEFGYYDQMHMVHDFGGFTGGTPTEMLAEIETLFQGQLAAIRAGRRASGDLQLIL